MMPQTNVSSAYQVIICISVDLWKGSHLENLMIESGL